MKKTLIVLLALLCAACISPSGSKKQDGGATVHIGKKYATYDESEQKVWLAYGVALGACSSDYPVYSFEHEVCARAKSIEIGKSLENSRETASRNLNQLIEVYDAGYIREYVWQHAHKRYWFKPVELRLEDFTSWASSNLTDHTPNRDPGVYFTQGQGMEEIDIGFDEIGDNTGRYPGRIGEFIFDKEVRYRHKPLGISIRYRHERLSTSYMDVYIYGLSDEYPKSDKHLVVTSEVSKAKADIYYYQDQGLYRDIRVIKEELLEQSDADYPRAAGVYRLNKGNLEVFSSIYITVIGEHYIKIRLTYPSNQYFEKSDHYRSVVDQVFAHFSAERMLKRPSQG